MRGDFSRGENQPLSQQIDTGPALRQAGDVRSPLVPLGAAGFVLLLSAFLLLLRSEEVRGRETPFVALLGFPFWLALAAGTAALLARMNPGVRHAYTFHFVAGFAGYSVGWAFTSLFAYENPTFMGLIFPGSAAASLGILCGTCVPRPRIAAAIAAFVVCVSYATMRPFFENAANLIFAFPAGAAAWFLMRELHRGDSVGSSMEAPMTHTGIAYPLVSFVAVFPLVAVVAMLFSGVFDILKSGDTADTIAATRPNEWSLVTTRLGVAGITAVLAMIVAAQSWLRSVDGARAAAAAFCVACGALLGGQAAGGAGLGVAGLAVVIVGVGCGVGFAGGVHGARWPRPFLAAMAAFLLGLNLIEPKAIPHPFESRFAAFTILAEGLLLAVIGAAFYWFVIVRIRDRFKPPTPRRIAMADTGPPPPPPPGTHRMKY
jgi:hypothetical protein